jgi:radical SAM enzyme (TIGR01210 family)
LSRQDGEEPYEVVALYNDGSFFSPTEIPEEAQVEIARIVAASGVRRLTVESLPAFVTEPRLQRFVEALGDVELEIGIGLQSSNDLVRETLVNTRITRRAFEDALQVMNKLGVQPKIYLMVKPPFLTDEEALSDVVSSVEYVAELGVEGVTLCPTRISANTVAWELWNKDVYEPPSLWTLLEAIRLTCDDHTVRVATMNLADVDFPSERSRGCPKCTDRLIDGIVRFSVDGDRSVLEDSCECRSDPKPVEVNEDEIVRRAAEHLKAVVR